MKLNNYVAMKIKEAEKHALSYSPFGFSTAGEIVHSFQTSILNIQQFTLQGRLHPHAEDQVIKIIVPRTITGISPEKETGQTFGWKGSINEYAAETAVWWAFDILTEDEGDRFLENERPSVIFQFIEMASFQELTVNYNGKYWDVLIDRNLRS